MPVPDFVTVLREHVGHDLLFLHGVTAVILDDQGRVLVCRRADNGLWALVSGILEPGEQPVAALHREAREETCVEIEVLGLAGVWVMPPSCYPNGDVAQYLDLTFLCRHAGGSAAVGDDESLEVAWVPPQELPEPFSPTSRTKLERALRFDGRTWLEGLGGDPHRPLATLAVPGGEVVVRRARSADLAAIVALLAADRLGATREDPGDLTAYRRALEQIDADPAQTLVVVEDAGEVVATLQLTTIPGLARHGALRAQVEAVRVAASHRQRGVGTALLEWAIAESRRRGCAMVQLTTDARRSDAQRFYQRLGFVSSHEGLKLMLGAPPVE